MVQYDLIVVGGGPGGYVAAIRAAKEGKRTALIEADELGGTCLNRGCIPSKTLLKHAEIIEDLQKAKEWGIIAESVTFSLEAMIARKNQVIEGLRNGIKHLLDKGKIDVFNGFGTVHPDKSVTINEQGNSKQITGSKIILATGSQPVVPLITGLEDVDYHTTDTIFDITSIPESLTIIGGGVIGVEFANIFSSLGTKVTIIELDNRVIATEDEDASKALLKALKKKGIKVLTNYKVQAIQQNQQGKVITVQTPSGNDDFVAADEVLLAVGRKPNLSGLVELPLQMNGRFIKVNEYLETSIPEIYAVGDIIGGLQLAHVASAEGLTAVANLDAPTEKMDYRVMPRCIYTKPQVASVGFSEKELIEKGISYKASTYAFSGNGKALTSGETDGFTKIFVAEKYGEILGVVMVGEQVTEIIGQASAYMYLEGTVDELAKMVQPHPSLSEVILETANALIGKGIHS